MKILVNNKDCGFFSTKPITIYRVEDQDNLIVWCNHYGAEPELYEDFYGRQEYREFCDKCGAWRAGSDEEWNDTPAEGDV